MGRTLTPPMETFADLLERLGNVSLDRIPLKPPPGKATEKDVIRLHARTDRLFELIDGTLVEKVMGFGEGFLATDIARLIGRYLDANDIGDVGGADAMMRILPGMVRIPDVCFIVWEKYPNRERPTEAIPGIYPDLAVEVLSESNTPGEMARKLKDYFFSGVRMVWFVEPTKRIVEVYTSPDQKTTLTESQSISGGDVLPGLNLPVRDVFARVPRTGKPKANGGRKRK